MSAPRPSSRLLPERYQLPLLPSAGSRRALFPVGPWAWRAMMAPLMRLEERRYNARPLATVDYWRDIPYAGEATVSPDQRLDVISPKLRSSDRLPVYVYLHGGGWTSGDKAILTKYCASQAETGMVVVNVNYRRARLLGRTLGRVHLRQMLHDANEALRWVREHAADFGGDPDSIVLGGDSAGAQIVSLLAATTTQGRLARHYGIHPSIDRDQIAGLVLHCGAVDFSVVFEPGFIMSKNFVRMLLPGRAATRSLRRAAHWLSPIEWLDESFAPVLVTTSERDIFYRANLNFVERARSHGVPVELLSYDWDAKNTEHTWQQDARHPESQEVYARLQRFVAEVSSRARSGAAWDSSRPHAAPRG